jgi:Transglutaminase-like superfamily
MAALPKPHCLLSTSTVVDRVVSWRELVHLSDVELERLDVALVHLLCAEGLPNTESLDIPGILASLDRLAEAVRQYTARVRHRFESFPETFWKSESVFRMACLVTFLQLECGIVTDKRLNKNPDFSDSRFVFLHGIFEGCGGTCATLPVLYAAVARRLGYPLRFSRTAHHMFARWEGVDGERFNVECTTQGLDCPPDEHYLTWPIRVNPRRKAAAKWLETDSPRMELSGFLLMRSVCFRDSGLYRQASEAIAWATAVAPENRLNLESTKRTLSVWRAQLERNKPARFPRLIVHLPKDRRFPAAVPPEVERELSWLETAEELLTDPQKQREWWGPLNASRGPWPAHVPTRIDVCRSGSPGFDR